MPLKPGLKPHEVTMMLIILENQLTASDSVSVFYVLKDIDKAGFTKAASNITIRELQRKELIKVFRAYEDSFPQNEEYIACQLTEKGENWILNNQEKVEFKKGKSQEPVNSEKNDLQELPF